MKRIPWLFVPILAALMYPVGNVLWSSFEALYYDVPLYDAIFVKSWEEDTIKE